MSNFYNYGKFHGHKKTWSVPNLYNAEQYNRGALTIRIHAVLGMDSDYKLFGFKKILKNSAYSSTVAVMLNLYKNLF